MHWRVSVDVLEPNGDGTVRVLYEGLVPVESGLGQWKKTASRSLTKRVMKGVARKDSILTRCSSFGIMGCHA